MKIHFVWLGHNRGAHCTATPLAVAAACPKDDVWLWILKEYASDFVEPTRGSAVRLMLLDSVEGPLGAQDWVADAYQVIGTLMAYQARAAAKDLAVLLILHKYGGLYLDTTCLLATDAEGKRYESKRLHGVKASSLPKAVKALPKSGPMLPLVHDDLIDYQPGAYSVKAVTVGYDDSLVDQHPIVKMPHIDVWSYFSPAGHGMFLEAARSYIKRAKVLGLDNVNSANTTGKKELEGDYRDAVIGALISHSVYDGMTIGLGLGPEGIGKVCWRGSRFKEHPTHLPVVRDEIVNADILPQIGIIKQYKGTWRTGS